MNTPGPAPAGMGPKRVDITDDISIGPGLSLVLIAGPCVIESGDHLLDIAAKMAEISRSCGIPYILKTSFDKANRTSGKSYRGPGLEEGLRIMAEVKERTGLPILLDVHERDQIAPAAEVAEILQIPAFLCRQTDFVQDVARSGRVVNIKKGQFLAPWDLRHVVEKIEAVGNTRILLTERGTSFGYNNLVVDFSALPVMASLGYPVVFDATHSVQLPGGAGNATGGRRQYVRHLARAAVAVGVDSLFLEVHDSPDDAPCDGQNMLSLEEMPLLLDEVLSIRKALNGR